MIDDFDKLSVTELRLRGMTSDQILAEQKRRGMSKQQIDAAWFPKPPTYNRIRSRRFRRSLVVATYCGWLLAAVVIRLVTPAGQTFPLIPFVPLANSVALLLWFARKTYLSREVLSGDSGLDERLVQNRNHAFRRSFQVFVPAALTGWVASLVCIWVQPGIEGFNNAVLIFLGATLLGTTLPTVIWAWREPDPVDSN